MTDKTALRRQLRQRRRALTPLQRRQAEVAVARQLRRLIRRGQRVAAYMAFGTELSLRSWLEQAALHGVSVYLPQIPAHGRKMRFSAWHAASAWRRNRFGIAEQRSRQTLAARQLDVVLLPLVGFDLAGNRLGQGGGYYDATLAFRRLQTHWKKPRLYGIAFDCQRVEQLPVEVHDIRLDGIISESGLLRHRGNAPHVAD
ncbi:5-formyltetrahydrofolate cyclo-ligase [Chitinimonas sp.]|uniref:5-formyltetrahydrofolate cyclo-ligase n=1 Tax=Chitinimonas sp. TaxID=1934313 RepID=UPI0035AFB189